MLNYEQYIHHLFLIIIFIAHVIYDSQRKIYINVFEFTNTTLLVLYTFHARCKYKTQYLTS